MLRGFLSVLILWTAPAWAGIDVSSFVPIDNHACVEKITSKQKDQLKSWGWDDSLPIGEIETTPYGKGWVCRFRIDSAGSHRLVVAFLAPGTGVYREIHRTATFPDDECGSKIQISDVHVAGLTSGSSVKTYLFLVTGARTGGCCGTSERSDTRLVVVDPEKSETPIRTFDFDSSCTADLECGAKCDPKQKKPADVGVRAQISWSLCDPSCDGIEMVRKNLSDGQKLPSILIHRNKDGITSDSQNP